MYGSLFQPRTSSYTAIRGYHHAISYSSPSRPIRAAPYSGIGDDQSISNAIVAPEANGSGRSTRIVTP